MSQEILMKALEEHGDAVKSIGVKADKTMKIAEEALDSVQRMEEKSVRLRGYPGMTGKKGPLQTFVKSSQFASMCDGAQSTGRVELSDIGIKTLVSIGRGQAGDSEYSAQVERGQGVRDDPRPAFQLLNVLPFIKVSAATYEYTRQTSFTNGADFQVVEGTLKAESDLVLDQVTANIATLAHWTRASVQVLSDEPSLMTYVGNLLGYGLLAKLENEIINGAGGTGKILGLTQQAEVFPVDTTEDRIYRIGAATSSMKAAGWKPGIVLINPVDWFDISALKTTDGQYLLGSPQSPAAATLWGNAVIESPSLAQGTVLVIDPANVAILDRMQPVIIATRFDRDNLVTNLVTLLAELRAGLAVFAQSAVQSVDIATVS